MIFFVLIGLPKIKSVALFPGSLPLHIHMRKQFQCMTFELEKNRERAWDILSRE